MQLRTLRIMKIDWTSDETYSDADFAVLDTELDDLAGGIGMLTIEVGTMIEVLTDWLLMKGKITKNQKKKAPRQFEMCKTVGDVTSSTLGPIINTVMNSDPAFSKDKDVFPKIVVERNYFQHDFMHIFWTSNVNLDKVARRLIQDICTVRKVINRYDQEVSPPKGPRLNLSDERLRNIIINIIDETVGHGNTIQLADLEKKLEERRIFVEDYADDIRSLVIRLGFNIN